MKEIKLEVNGVYYIRKAGQNVGEPLSKIRVTYVDQDIVKFYYADANNEFHSFQYPSSERVLPVGEIIVFSRGANYK